MQADTNEAVRQVLQAIGPALDPATAKAGLEIVIETSNMPSTAKKRFRDARQDQPDPAQQQQLQMQQRMQQQAAMLEMQGKDLDNRKTQAEISKLTAEAQEIGTEQQANQQNRMLDAVGKQQDQQARREGHAMDLESDAMKLAIQRINLRAAAARAMASRPAPMSGPEGFDNR